MTSPQQPVASPFDSSSTAQGVLEGIDLAGTFAVVTGGYSGLGLETTRALKNAGADVVVPARRPDHAKGLLDGLAEVEEMDLGDLESVRRFAMSLVAAGRPIDLLINNAGIMANPETRVGPGWESQLATNHFGHYALANLVWPLLADGGARVVALSSTGHKLSDIRWDDPHFTTDPYDEWVAYGQAKSANSLFAVQLDALGKDVGVRSFSVHPGGIMTELQRHMPKEDLLERGWIDADGNPNPLFKTPEGGASTAVWAATSPLLDRLGGVYCEDCNVASPTDPESDFARFMGVNDHAVNPQSAERLWAMTAEATGINTFG